MDALIIVLIVLALLGPLMAILFQTAQIIVFRMKDSAQLREYLRKFKERLDSTSLIRNPFYRGDVFIIQEAADEYITCVILCEAAFFFGVPAFLIHKAIGSGLKKVGCSDEAEFFDDSKSKRLMFSIAKKLSVIANEQPWDKKM